MFRCVITIAVVVSVSLLSAQEPQRPAAAPAFEVVSIKPNNSGSAGTRAGYAAGGRFNLENGPTATLIWQAYPAALSELVGAPAWVTSDRYDVTVVAAGEPSIAEMGLMMQTMLADRFKLKVHYETRDRSTYSLKLARDDGRLGTELHRSQFDCAVLQDANRRNGPETVASNGAPACGMQQSGGVLRSGGLGMGTLAAMISGAAGRKVLDKTGLTGPYEFTLRYNSNPVAAPDAANDLPSIFTALQEQLGLKLEPDHAELNVVVIDHIERPSPD